MTLRAAIRPFAVAVGLILSYGIGPVCVSMLTPARAEAQVTVNLRDADLKSFVEIVSEATGRNFVLDPNIRGTVTVLAPGQMTPAELYEVFLAVLELNRLTLIEGAGADRIVQMSSARELASGPDVAGSAGTYETRVIQVDHIPPQEVIDVVRPLLPAEAVLTAVPGTSMLLLSDRGQNYRRIEALIKRLDQPQDDPIQMIRLRNANAAEVAQVIQAMEILPQGAALTVDRRSNALIISGPDAVYEKIRVLAARLDTQQNNVVSQAIGLNYADAASLSDIILRVIEGEAQPNEAPVRIVPEPQTNTLLITAPQDRMDDIIQMVRYLDRRPRQVLVEAVIFEMSVDGFSDLSVQFAGILNNAVIGGAQFSLQGRPSLTNLVSAVINGQTIDVGSGGVIAGVPDNTDRGIAGLLSAIAATNSTRLLSTPSIMTLNNKEAEIVVAQNVPFVTGSYSTVSGSAVDNPFQTIERQDVGLTLKVTPQINADRTVKLDIKQEVSSLTNTESSAGGEITAKRALSTTVLVKDGNVILLGGLLENGAGSVSQRVPGLSKLPLLGGLFRGKNATKNQRVLLVLMRPQVVNTEEEARKLTQQLSREAKQAAQAIQPLDDGSFPRTSGGGLPFDGANLNQPFDAGFVDDVAQSRKFPPLPSRVEFDGR
ncbi:type II secretion system protein GspD [Thalassobius vesicularis]|uniref:Type II secretion system protein GspD n=1 Tax=Thalassobius vesicularis TaxID=1294297 RepID=A0A4S3MD76_9RHOB|nr:type II secretion system secretin GspD [Thalassobius vesicularis]THD76801.1 type II secretion system protein GspD [Thalassobius vesicularis]